MDAVPSTFEADIVEIPDNIKPVAQDFPMSSDNLDLMLLQSGIGSYDFAIDEFRYLVPSSSTNFKSYISRVLLWRHLRIYLSTCPYCSV